MNAQAKRAPASDSRTPDLPAWARMHPQGLRLALHVQPGARRSQIVGEHGSRLKIALNAPPVDGKANDELLSFLASCLGLRRGALELAAGHASREKSVSVACEGRGAAALVGRLMEQLPPR
jgi:hypothetical protein